MAICFVYGDDAFLVGREIESRVHAAVGDSVEALDGGAPPKSLCGFLRTALGTLSLFGPQGIWIKSPAFVQKAPAEQDESFVADLLDILEGAHGSDVPIFISSCTVDRRLKAFKKLVKWSDAHEVLGDGEAFLDGEIKRRRLNFPGPLRRKFLQKTGGDLQFIDGELEKLQLHGDPDQPVAECDIDDLVCTGPEDRFFEPIDAFFSRNWHRLRDVMAGGEWESRALIAAFQSRVRLLIQLKAANLRNFSKQVLDRWVQRMKIQPLPFSGKQSPCVFFQNPYYLSRLHDAVDAFSLPDLAYVQRRFTQLFQAQLPSLAANDILSCLPEYSR
jgi:DNA polymerase III delta subunit